MAAASRPRGKIVYVNTIATFITRRCFEQVVLIWRFTGECPADQAAAADCVYPSARRICHRRHRHHALFEHDRGAVRCQRERRLVPLTVRHRGPLHPSWQGWRSDHCRMPFAIGRAIPMAAGRTLRSTGITERLPSMPRRDSRTAARRRLHMHTIKPLDVNRIRLRRRFDAIVVIEEHTILGGLLGGALAKVVAGPDSTSEAIQTDRHPRHISSAMIAA